MKKLYTMSLTICAIGLFILSNGITFAGENVTEQLNDTADQTEAIFEDTVAEDADIIETTTAQVTQTTTVPTPGQIPKSPGFGLFITIVALVSVAYILLRR